MPLECFADVCADAGAAAEELFGEDVFFLIIAEIAVEINNTKGELF